MPNTKIKKGAKSICPLQASRVKKKKKKNQASGPFWQNKEKEKTLKEEKENIEKWNETAGLSACNLKELYVHKKAIFLWSIQPSSSEAVSSSALAFT